MFTRLVYALGDVHDVRISRKRVQSYLREFDNGDKITIMVNKRVVSLYGDEPPEDDQGRKIKVGPLYDRDHVLRLVKEESLVFWTQKCGRDIQGCGFDFEDVAELISTGFGKRVFLGSKWCEQESNGPWAACDAYRIFRLEWSEVAHKKIEMEYYIKFAISKTGKSLLMVSFHPSVFS